MFPGFIHKCPYKILKIYNATVSLTEAQKLALNIPNRQLYPNGLYKNRMAFYDDLDDKILEIIYYYELYSYARDGELK
jgi:hypothetical protein